MRRRTKQIQLIAMGTVVLGGCGPQLPDDRYVYKSHEQCVQDWGEENCQHGPRTHDLWGNVTGGYCYGPRFNSYVNLPSGNRMWSGSYSSKPNDPSSGRQLGATAVKVNRGGFGSSSRHFFSSGS